MALYVIRDKETKGKAFIKIYQKLTDAEEYKKNYERYVTSLGFKNVEPFELVVYREHGVMKGAK